MIDLLFDIMVLIGCLYYTVQMFCVLAISSYAQTFFYFHVYLASSILTYRQIQRRRLEARPEHIFNR